MRWTVALALALAAVALAGCAQSGDAFDQEIRSGVLAEAPPQADQPSGPAEEGLGRLAGVVVDEAIRPIEGAHVTLTGVDAAAVTAGDGSFGLDLAPGSYFLQASAEGYHEAQAMVDVPAGDTTRIRVILAGRLPTDPFLTTVAFDGFAELTDAGQVGYLMIGRSMVCSLCDFTFEVAPEGRTALLLEAVMPQGTFERGFEHYLVESGEYGGLSYAMTPNPMRVELSNDILEDRESFYLRLSPWSSPAPEADQQFRLFVTAFYNAPMPADWSALEEGA